VGLCRNEGIKLRIVQGRRCAPCVSNRGYGNCQVPRLFFQFCDSGVRGVFHAQSPARLDQDSIKIFQQGCESSWERMLGVVKDLSQNRWWPGTEGRREK